MLNPNDVDPIGLLPKEDQEQLAQEEAKIDERLRTKGEMQFQVIPGNISKKLVYLANKYYRAGWFVLWDHDEKWLWIKHPMLVRDRQTLQQLR